MQVGIRELQAKERDKHGQLLQLKLFLKASTRYMIEEYNYQYTIVEPLNYGHCGTLLKCP